MIRKCAAVFADILAVLAFGLALFIACKGFPNNSNTTFDYQAILVTILSGLFTLIVGWNIYQTIDLNRKVSEIDTLRVRLEGQLKKMKDDVECDKARFLGMLSQSAAATFVPNERTVLKYKMITHALDAIEIFSIHPENEKSKESIDKIIDTTINGLRNSKEIKFDKLKVQDLVLKCGQIQDRKDINEFQKLVTLIQETVET